MQYGWTCMLRVPWLSTTARVVRMPKSILGDFWLGTMILSIATTSIYRCFISHKTSIGSSKTVGLVINAICNFGKSGRNLIGQGNWNQVTGKIWALTLTDIKEGNIIGQNGNASGRWIFSGRYCEPVLVGDSLWLLQLAWVGLLRTEIVNSLSIAQRSLNSLVFCFQWKLNWSSKMRFSEISYIHDRRVSNLINTIGALTHTV